MSQSKLIFHRLVFMTLFLYLETISSSIIILIKISLQNYLQCFSLASFCSK